ncbi:MAG: hypothetical protein LUO96_06050 [Methanomicrobiales archaeon]|nr:hypothetical protein [Methanomicrobiales archaeon]
MTGKEDSLLVHIDRIELSEAISPDRSYQGLLMYALHVSSPESFLTNMQTIMQKTLEAIALGDLSGTVLEVKDTTGHRIPRGMLLRILGIASFEGRNRNGELVIFTPGPTEPDVLLSFILRRNPDIAEGEMKTDPIMAKILKDALGSGGKVPSASAHDRISRMCRPDTPVANIPRLFGMISESLRGEGIPESNILEYIRADLSGTCPSCHRSYRGEEIVLLCGMKDSMRVQETLRKRSPDVLRERSPGDSMDPNRLLYRLNKGICLNPSCNSGSVDLSWT